MKIIKTKDSDEMSRKAADVIAEVLKNKPDCVLGLATGTTPIGLYECLIEDCKAGKISFAKAKSFNLDEYRGLEGTHDQSYRYFMNKYLFDHVDIDKSQTHVPEGSNPDADKVAQEYEKAIKDAGGIDIQLLGLGGNGHIGFNEPNIEFDKITHCVDLTQETIEANSRLFDSIDDVPRQAYTMGVGTIMAAKKVLLVANGAAKAKAVKESTQGPVVPSCPASVLQFHQDCTVVVDAEASAQI